MLLVGVCVFGNDDDCVQYKKEGGLIKGLGGSVSLGRKECVIWEAI